ncbi:MAG: HNH endonuclease signature motif containing protein [Deltaproteobacteria bacterium]|nr:HNH endonuclease signature motif containing protein [Deltaproteobacteria bacterium]
MVLRAHPLCNVEDCKEAATDIDHIIPIAKGGDDSEWNLQALCHSHHSRKTAIEDGGWGRGRDK